MDKTEISNVLPLDYYETSKGRGLVYDHNGLEVEVYSSRENGEIHVWDEDGNEYYVVERFD